jgi:hypothetical protein
MKDILIEGSETYKRSAYVNKNSKGYFVCLTDWSTRRGGSYAELTLEMAVSIGREFVNGAGYVFDKERGIVLF